MGVAGEPGAGPQPAHAHTVASGNIIGMLRGSREVILRKVQPVSVHGQISWDVYFADAEDPDGQVSVARVGPETVSPRLEPGDRIRLDYVMGIVTAIHKVPLPPA